MPSTQRNVVDDLKPLAELQTIETNGWTRELWTDQRDATAAGESGRWLSTAAVVKIDGRLR